jgi:hypothetical protein
MDFICPLTTAVVFLYQDNNTDDDDDKNKGIPLLTFITLTSEKFINTNSMYLCRTVC